MESYLLVVILFCGTMAAFEDEMSMSDGSQDDKMDNEDVLSLCDFLRCHHHKDHEHDTTPTPIAFSTLFENQVDKAGEGQHMKFKNVLLNDGQGYNPNTGIFRAPVCGVYSFTYVVSSTHPNFVSASLMAKGKKVNSAYAQVPANRNNKDQGTNTAIIHLHKNEQVWVAFGKGSTIKENDNLLKSFSGFLLYTRE